MNLIFQSIRQLAAFKSHSLFFVQLFFLPYVVISQNINTVAGSGATGYSGDGGPATSASFDYPMGITMDTLGNLFISDHYNHCLRKVITGGVITTIAGTINSGFSGDGGQAITAQLNLPSGIALDRQGNIYIADYFNFRIRKITSSGIITTIAGNGMYGNSGNGGLATLAKIGHPYNIKINKFGDIYFTDEGFHCIRKINTLGIISNIAGTGTPGFSGDGGLATLAKFEFPQGLALDAKGNIYIADTYNMRIRKIDTLGIITTIVGIGTQGFSGDGGLSNLAQLDNPAAVDVDFNGNIYIADYWGNRIRKVNQAGIISTICGTGAFAYSGDGGPAVLASIKQPTDLYINGCDLYINDSGNQRIRVITNVVKIEIISQPNTNLSICEQDSIFFSTQASAPNLTYQWYHNQIAIPGANLPHYLKSHSDVSDNGTYYCIVSNSCSSVSTDTSFVIVSNNLFPPKIINTCALEQTQLFTPNPNTSYSWTPQLNLTFDSLYVETYFQDIGEYNYHITATLNGCTQEDSLLIKVSDCSLVIPNVVSSNNDGINDVWFIKDNNEIKSLTVTIIDRWGNKVFERKNEKNLTKEKGWSPENSSSGTYFYIIQYLTNKNEQKNLKGYISVF